MRPGEVIGERFELTKRIGSGGMGTVWRAHDRISGQSVALKVLRDPEGDGALRFLKEANILANLEHPHVVRHVAHGIASTGEPFLAMEYLEGESLLARLERGPLNFDEWLVLGRLVARALGAAHEQRIVHRDIKPGNLFLVRGSVEQVKIVDFGIARRTGTMTGLTHTGSILGTPGYLSPEQARGDKDTDARSDVFALGCVLFECLAGQSPFHGAHPMALLAKLLLEDPPRLTDLRPDVPPPMVDACMHMLAKDPEQRPKHGHEVNAILEKIDWRGRGASANADPPRTVLTGNERRLVSIVAAFQPNEGQENESNEALLSAVRRVALPLGGRVVELSSGAVVAVLLAEGSVVDQASSGAQCALWVRNAAPTAVVVLVTGRGESTSRLPVGEALERAASLLDEALTMPLREAWVLIDDNTRGLLDVRFQLAERGGRVWLQSERQSGQEGRTLLGKPSPFVGREREMRNVLDLVEESFEERRPSGVLVTAAPGMGKSRLRQELMRTIIDRFPNVACMLARPDAFGSGSAYSLLSGALRAILQISAGEPIAAQRNKIELLAAILDNPVERRATAEFLGELVGAPFPDDDSPRLRAARQNRQLMADLISSAYCTITAAVANRRPILIVLEDLHWGDGSSLKIILNLLRDLKELPIVVLGFARPEVHDVFPKLFESRNIEEIRLRPLAKRAATDLVTSALGQTIDPARIGALVERSEGNAFFLEELIRAIAENRDGELPDTVLGMVEARLVALSAEARRVLRAASIFGDVFWESAVAELLGVGDPITSLLTDLCGREILTKRPHSRFAGHNEYAFQHAMLREGANAMLSDRDRHVGHRLAALWLKRAGEADAFLLAEHFQRGQDMDNAVIHYLRAGSQAFERDDLNGTLQCAERGRKCGAKGEFLGNLHTLEATAYCWRSELAAAREASVSALPLVARGSRWECLLLFHGTWAALVVGDEENFTLMANRFVEFEPDLDARADYALWAPLAASLLTSYGRAKLSRALVDRAERLDPTIVEQNVGLAGALAVGQSDHLRAFERAPHRLLQLTRRAVEAFQAIGDTRNQATALNRFGQALAEIGEWEEGEQVLRAGVELAQRIRVPFAELQSAMHLAALLVTSPESAKWEEAERIVSGMLSTAGLSAGYRGWALGIRAQAFMHRGKFVEAVEEARAARVLCERLPARRLWIDTLLTRALLVLGQTDEAREVCREIEKMILVFEGGYIEVNARLAIAELHASLGEMVEARASLEETRRRIEERAADIPDENARMRYLENVPENKLARNLAARWLGSD
ncbi:MAG TPA: protein kinase [Polyangium sp.]|nr:protein kinase [Polyangium sp.]